VTPEGIQIAAKALPEKIRLGRGLIRYDGKNVNFSDFEARMADTLIKMSGGSLVIAPLGFNADLAAEIDLDSIWKLMDGILSNEQKRVIPGGKAAFTGKLAYDSKGVRVDGTLNSEQITLKEKQTAAQALIERVRIHFDSISPTSGQVKIESIEVKGAGAAVKISGAIKNAADPGFDLTASGNLNVEEFSRLGAGLFKVPVREGQFKGDLALDLKVGGTLSAPLPKGRLEFKKLYADLSERGLVISNLDGAAAADTDSLDLSGLSAELMGGKLSISGKLSNFKKPLVDAKASVTGADLASIRKLLKINFPDMAEEIEFSGKADLNVALSGSVAEPSIKGDAVLHAGRFNHPAVLRPIENIEGPITFTNAGLDTSGVKAAWGSSQAVVTGSLKNWAKFISDFKFTVDPLDVTDAAGFFLKDTGYKLEGKGTGSGSITGAVEKIKVDVVASMTSGVFAAPVSEKGDMFRFPFTNLQAKAFYVDKVLNVSSASLELFSGKVTAQGKVLLDKEPIEFDFNTRINNLMTQQFLAENTSYKDIVQGGLDGTFVAKGNTTGLVSLNGNASLAMQKGFYNSPPFVKQISQQLDAPQLASGPIENVAGDYTIAGGRISSKNTVGKSKDGKVTFVGSVGLDATLDGEAQIQIKREVCQQSNVLRQLIGDAQVLDIPVTLKGSFMSPSVGLPLDRMLQDVAKRRAEETIKKEAGKALGKLFGIKDSPAPAASASTPVAPAGVTPANSLPAQNLPPQTASPAQQSPQTPQKKIENKIKEVGKELKNLKNIFKFKR
jgi:autotransporter translocation and assembly factor TamB